MALSEKSKIEVYQFLKVKILRKIEDYDLSDEDSVKPFQYALFTKKGYLAKGFIHGCETALGSWHESVAKIIAKKVNPIIGLYLIQAKATTKKKVIVPTISAMIKSANPTISLRSHPIKGIHESNSVIGSNIK